MDLRNLRGAVEVRSEVDLADRGPQLVALGRVHWMTLACYGRNGERPEDMCRRVERALDRDVVLRVSFLAHQGGEEEAGYWLVGGSEREAGAIRESLIVHRSPGEDLGYLYDDMRCAWVEDPDLEGPPGDREEGSRLWRNWRPVVEILTLICVAFLMGMTVQSVLTGWAG